MWLTIAEKTTACMSFNFITSGIPLHHTLFSELCIAMSLQRPIYASLHWPIL